MRRVLIVAAVAACNYSPPGPANTGDNVDPDAGVDAPMLAGPIVPSNHPDTTALDESGLGSLEMTHLDDDGGTVWRIYTDTGLIEHETPGSVFVEFRAAMFGSDPATKLRIERVGTFTVLFVDRLEVAPEVSFEGHGSRPLIVIAKGTIEIGGEIDFSGGFIFPRGTSANFRIGGPGGGDGAVNTTNPIDTHGAGCDGEAGTGGGSAGVGSPGDQSGGGGGGGGLDGARGGDKAAPSDVGGAGGIACIPATLVPLVGGGGGGAGDTVGGGGHGGGGGGAIQLSSMTSVSITGRIDAGGKGGFAQIFNDEGGGGGGAGGGILLEAPVITVDGTLAANGGGGGSGREPNDGAQGTLTELGALGGAGSGGGNDGGGGNGGAKASPATAGDDQSNGAGGGGGGVGVVRINVAGTQLSFGGGAVVSPASTQGAVVFQ